MAVLVASFVLFVCLGILGMSYALYYDSHQQEQPVVVFKAHIWREAYSLIPLLVFNGMMLVLAGVLVIYAISSIGLSFMMLRQHISYWQHDRYTTLTIYRQEQRAEYRNVDVFLSFALADVVQIIQYTPNSSRAIYSYQVFVLADGTELLLTCLMYSMLGPQELMPAALRQTVRCHGPYGCWLPGQELRFPTLF
jgi:uncharacterized protein with PQ loop repeat